MSRLDLSKITLFCFETREPLLAEWAIKQCLFQVDFKNVVLVTNVSSVKNPLPEIDYVQAPTIRSVKDYSRWMMTELRNYVPGSHVLVIQWDSFVTNPNLWSNDFLNYDYIGPVWPHHPETPVGNGGFSLRSARLLSALLDPEMKIGHPEDYYICAENKQLLEEKYGIQFAPVTIAEQFAVERTAWHPAFGFHGLFNFANVLDEEGLIQVIDLMPREMLGGLDTYDLIEAVEKKNFQKVAKNIRGKITFQWKFRYRYLINKIKLLA